jgi:hypothetical protein
VRNVFPQVVLAVNVKHPIMLIPLHVAAQLENLMIILTRPAKIVIIVA